MKKLEDTVKRNAKRCKAHERGRKKVSWKLRSSHLLSVVATQKWFAK